jgi:hypothetical protein
VLRDDIVDNAMEWIRSIYRGRYTLEQRMRETGYDGKARNVLKNTLEGKMDFGYRTEVASLL